LSYLAMFTTPEPMLETDYALCVIVMQINEPAQANTSPTNDTMTSCVS